MRAALSTPYAGTCSVLVQQFKDFQGFLVSHQNPILTSSELHLPPSLCLAVVGAIWWLVRGADSH